MTTLPTSTEPRPPHPGARAVTGAALAAALALTAAPAAAALTAAPAAAALT
ncbi:hypothetical protein JJV70_06110, partial [Streptomyces sp. JJ66]|nr:hypothetical protein [Streptomyces sp. JJ66]